MNTPTLALVFIFGIAEISTRNPLGVTPRPPIDGLSGVILMAIDEGAVAVLVWAAMVFVVIAIGGHFPVDILYGYLDPRIRAD